MKHITFIQLFLLSFGNAYSQKDIKIPDNEVVVHFLNRLTDKLDRFGLDDLRSSTDSISIRIWRTNSIITIKADNLISCDLKIFIDQNPPIVSQTRFSSNASKKIFDSLDIPMIMSIIDDSFRGVDGAFVFFEISTPKSYRIFRCWSPDTDRNENCKNIVKVLRLVDDGLRTNQVRRDFLDSLEPGNYTLGMSSIRIDRFLNKDIPKTDLYTLVENRIRKELGITDKTSYLNFPLVMINDKISTLVDINLISLRDVKSLEVLKADGQTTALYGTNGIYGVIRVMTK